MRRRTVCIHSPTETSALAELGDGITTIDTDFIAPRFDASHLIVENGHAAFVDTGVNDSVDNLMQALRAKDIDAAAVDYVFLTHVHLDHAGGAGKLMRKLPNAQAVLHPRGAPHMIDPARLTKGAEAVYGVEPFRKMYGDIVPIEAERVMVVTDQQEVSLGGRPMRCLFTEGHARHHYCLSDPTSNGVFTGDSFGISYRQLDTDKGVFIYPTTTPVHFDPPEAHKSIDRIMGEQPEQVFLTHYSRVDDLPRLAGDMHRRIDDFVALARRHADDDNRTEKMHKSMFEYFRHETRQHGVQFTDEQLHAVVDKDVELNTMGLEHWLNTTQE
jgi:glyoxylase-like metal-dependent hydrolase (beta-lactamase superfamily II)